jgi:hypothetical protein
MAMMTQPRKMAMMTDADVATMLFAVEHGCRRWRSCRMGGSGAVEEERWEWSGGGGAVEEEQGEGMWAMMKKYKKLEEEEERGGGGDKGDGSPKIFYVFLCGENKNKVRYILGGRWLLGGRFGHSYSGYKLRVIQRERGERWGGGGGSWSHAGVRG